jgi:serine/threonine protein kinase/Tfp pilus assembly protein PilF
MLEPPTAPAYPHGPVTPERWAKVKEVFVEAVGQPADRRSAFLSIRCDGDVELKETVERLLTSHAASGDFIEVSPVQGIPTHVAAFGPLTGATRGHYRFGRRVGTGGMGEVYEAWDARTDRRVAVKVLTDSGADAASRLTREGAHALELDHPNICRVHEVVSDGTGAFIVMEFIEGTTLADAVPAAGFDAAAVMTLAVQFAAGVKHAHERGIIHRDLKLANLMLTGDGGLKVLDFGLARRLPQHVASAVSAASLSEAGVIAGTLTYLSPEVLHGERADARSDVWAFGVVLQQLLTGTEPFDGRTPFELTSKVLREPPKPMPPSVPGGLRTIRDNCLAKDPSERYQNGGELLAALQALQSGARVPRRASRKPQRRIAAIVAGTLVTGAAVLALLASMRETSVVRPSPSIAVLPLRGDPDFFADGVTEGLIARLGTVDSLRVISRTSSTRYRAETSLEVIRRDLQADVVVRGTVDRGIDRVALTAELVETATGRQLWRERFERPTNEVLALENDAIRGIVDRLGVRISDARHTTLRVVRAVDPVMYEAYLKGRFHWNRRTSDSLQQAVAFYNSAIERDPTYAPAHAALADCYNLLGTVQIGAASPLEMRPRARAAAIRAIQADESLAEAHATLGYVSHYDWDWALAEREFRRAIELNPNLALAHTWYANYLVSRGRLQDALAEVRLAEQLDPFSLVVVTNVGWTLSYNRRWEEAIAAYRRALALDPTYVQARRRLADALMQAGRLEEAGHEVRRVVEMTRRSASSLGLLADLHAISGRRAEARAVLDELRILARSTYVSPTTIYEVYFRLGDHDNAFAWLDVALKERSNSAVYLLVDDFTEGVRDDPRFRRAVDMVGLPHGR